MYVYFVPTSMPLILTCTQTHTHSQTHTRRTLLAKTSMSASLQKNPPNTFALDKLTRLFRNRKRALFRQGSFPKETRNLSNTRVGVEFFWKEPCRDRALFPKEIELFSKRHVRHEYCQLIEPSTCLHLM